jgi:hypothetical protein
MSGQKRLLLQGRIRSLANFDKDDWARREIIVEQDVLTRYPQVGDQIRLIDSDNEIYELTFIKGANVSGYTCLGQPGMLKKWFQQHYRSDKVDKDDVFLNATGPALGEFRIWTSREWSEKQRT